MKGAEKRLLYFVTSSGSFFNFSGVALLYFISLLSEKINHRFTQIYNTDFH